MKKTDQNEPQTTNDPSTNEIDDFAQKLLDKKAELALFPDDDFDFTSSSLEGTMSEAQRKTAESSMLSALDQLRRERGQATIEEEERHFAMTHPVLKKHLSKTKKNESSVPKKQPSAFSETPHSDSEKENPAAPSPYENIGPNRYETRSREDHFEKQEERPVRQHSQFYKQPKFWLIVVSLAVVAALFGAYTWKVTVYDPAHTSNAQQDYAYKKLVNFADEYSMKSDAQKKDILNLEVDYNSLPEAKKNEINEYFQNPKHTGKTFVELLNEMKQASLNESDPNYLALVDYANQYASLAPADQLDILNRIGPYQALNSAQQDHINSILQASTGKNFMTLYNEARAQSQPVSQPAAEDAPASSAPTASASSQEAPVFQNEQTAAASALEQQLNQLYADRASYLQFLSEEGMSPDDIVAQYDAQIADLEAQLGF